MATRKDFAFVETPGDKSQHGLMVENFADLILNGNAAGREAWLEATAKTQGFLDAIWQEIRTQG